MEDMALEDDALRHQKRRKIFENDQEGRTRSKGEAATLDIRLAPAQGPEHLYASTIEEHGNEACMEGPGRKSFGWNGGTAEGGVTAQQEGNDDSGLGFTTIAGSDQASAAAQQGQTDTVDVDAIDGGNIANVQHPVEVHLSPTRDRFGNVPGFAGAAEGWTNAQSGQQVHGPEVQEWEWEAPTQHQEQRMDQGGYAAGRSKIYRQPRSYEIEKDRESRPALPMLDGETEARASHPGVVVTSLSDTESERSAASTTRSKHGPIADRIDAGEDDDDDIIELTRPSTSSSAASETILQPGDGRNGFILSPTYLSAIDRNALSANDRQGLAELVRKLRSGGSGPWQSQMQRDRQGGMIVYRRPPGYGKGPFSMTRNNTNGKMLEQDASHRFELVNEDDVSMQGTAGMEDVAMNDDEDTGFMINEASAPQPMESEDNDTMEIG